MDRDSYFLRLTRYIHRNPIETKSPLVNGLEDYPWSSYPHYIHQSAPKNWLYRDETYEMLGGKAKRYVEDHAADTEILSFYRREHIPLVLGSEQFVKRISRKSWKNISADKLKK